MKYRKKPVVIDAIQWNGRNLDEITNFVGDSLAPIERRPDYKLKIKTLESGEGHHEAEINDFIIKGIQGEFYPCKPQIFETTYEIAE